MLVIAVLTAGAVGTGQIANAAVANVSPSIRIINFAVTNDRSKTFFVPKGGTFFECPGFETTKRIKARGIASGMSSRTSVTVTWAWDRKIIYEKTEAWGTPTNGLFGYFIGTPPALKNGTYVVRFVSRGKLLGKGWLSVACGGTVDSITPP
jgi:hypothetical protein